MFPIALLVIPIKSPREMFKIRFRIRFKTFTILSMLFQSTLTENLNFWGFRCLIHKLQLHSTWSGRGHMMLWVSCQLCIHINGIYFFIGYSFLSVSRLPRCWKYRFWMKRLLTVLSPVRYQFSGFRVVMKLINFCCLCCNVTFSSCDRFATWKHILGSFYTLRRDTVNRSEVFIQPNESNVSHYQKKENIKNKKCWSWMLCRDTNRVNMSLI